MNITETPNAADAYDLRAKFDYFNELCFDGALPAIPLKFALLKGMGGVCKCKIIHPPLPRGVSAATRKRLSTLEPGSINIVMDRTYIRDEKALDGILIHEMMHAWFYLNGMLGESHGMKFEALRKKLETRVGFKVPMTDDVQELELVDLEIKRLVVLLWMKSDGKYAYALASPTAYFTNSTALSKEWETRGRDGEKLRAYDIRTSLWTQYGAMLPVQRVKKLAAISFYKPDRDDLIPELIAKGKLLAEFEGSRRR